MSPVLVIAEAGVNHNGSPESALALVDAAADAGADVVKFQTFTAARLATAAAPKAEYQRRDDAATGQLEMLKKLELDETAHHRLLKRCRERGIRFLSSPFDLESLALLDRLGLPLLKLASGEITNLPLLRAAAHLGQPLILSTGMAELEEVAAALAVLEGAGLTRERVTLLHCHSDYPTAMADVHLRAMATLRERFGVMIGYSDHTLGIEVPIAAVALGAVVIEKHFTLDRDQPGPDHRASLEPEELAAMVRAIRNIELALGSPEKRPSAAELKTRRVARKSVVAARPIAAGETFTEENLTTKRPGDGLSPMLWDRLVGRPARRAYATDEPIEPAETAE